MTVRTFLIGLLAILILSLGSFGVYWFLFRETETTSTTVAEETGSAFPVIPGIPSANSKPGSSAGSAQSGTGGEEGEIGQITLSQDSGVTERGILSSIGNGPIAGYAILGNGTSTAVHYIEQTTGHLFELKTGETVADKISNTTLPKIQKAILSADGKNAVLRVFSDSLNTVDNLLSTVIVSTSTTGTSALGELRSSLLPRTIVDISASPDRKSLFYLNKVGSGVVGISTDFQTKKQTQIFDSLRTEWTVDWPSANTIALTPKASQNAAGTLYLLNSTTKGVERYLDGTLGLTTLVNHSRSLAMFNRSTPTSVLSSVLNLINKESQLLPETTFPEKCTWSTLHPTLLYCGVPLTIRSARYPDDWYKGSVTFQDRIMVIDTETGATNILLNPGDAPQSLDATELQLDPKEENLYFINKTDRTLWKISLE